MDVKNVADALHIVAEHLARFRRQLHAQARAVRVVADALAREQRHVEVTGVDGFGHLLAAEAR